MIEPRSRCATHTRKYLSTSDRVDERHGEQTPLDPAEIFGPVEMDEVVHHHRSGCRCTTGQEMFRPDHHIGFGPVIEPRSTDPFCE